MYDLRTPQQSYMRSAGHLGWAFCAGIGAKAAALETPSPVYPRLSQRHGEEGSVLCRLSISEQGTVTAVEVLESSGHERLDEAARTALLTWRFRPRREGGLAVASTLDHRVIFRLESR